jgi:fatty-acyl-CoA synthase
VTGDLGEVDDQGVISVFGRADEVIVTGGDAVFPAEVEHVLESHPEVREAIVVGIPNEVFGSQVVAVFSGDALIAELERFARAHLAGFKVPKRWVRLERIPKTGLDKPDRQMLIEMLSRI